MIKAWCSTCRKFRTARIGSDPLVEGRITEILKWHFHGLWKCPMSGQDADPVVTQPQGDT